MGNGDVARLVKGEGMQLLFLTLWVFEMASKKCAVDHNPVIGGKDQVGQALDWWDGENGNVEINIGIFERFPLKFCARGVDGVVYVHPGVDGVLDIKVVGWRHYYGQFCIWHTKDEYSRDQKLEMLDFNPGIIAICPEN